MLYNLFKQLAFQIDPEKAHHLSIQFASRFPALARGLLAEDIDDEKYHVSLAGQEWIFPVGLAAGLDKNAEALSFFSEIGFGAIEVGTVTPLAQAGNPRPRLWRYPKIESLRNAMGFNNLGMDQVFDHIQCQPRPRCPLGVNLGKNKATPPEQAASDYRKLYTKFAPLADYLVINVSSPNTPGLRNLQGQDELRSILSSLGQPRQELSKPLFVKISPDINPDDIQGIVAVTQEFNMTGLIATNTTIVEELGPGGISGQLLKEKAKFIRTETLRYARNTGLEVIGVGGISTYEDLVEFWKMGGRVVQIYTSFIYHGPALLKAIKDRIDQDLNKFSLRNVEALISHYKEKSETN